jgi:hypothetical protein
MPSLSNTIARTVVVAATAVGLAAVAPGAAQAKEKTFLSVSGYAATTPPVNGVSSFTGFVTGDPFYGFTHTGTFGPDDGTFPQSQACEPASGTMTVGDSAGTVTFALEAEMCDQYGTYPSFGSWTVTSATGALAKAKGTGQFSWNAQWWGTLWSMTGTLRA